MIEIKTLYDALKMFGGADTWDTEYDEVICWERCDDVQDEDVCFKCATEMAKRIEIAKVFKDGGVWEFVADISKFVRQHIQFMFRLSQGFKWPMPNADPDDDESIYRGVQIVNAMQAGYACDEQYEAMLKELGCL